jgi:hypothetical protein
MLRPGDAADSALQHWAAVSPFDPIHCTRRNPSKKRLNSGHVPGSQVVKILAYDRSEIEIDATSLFEAALSLSAVHSTTAAVPDRFSPMQAFVKDTGANYEVRLPDFIKWLDNRGDRTTQMSQRKPNRVRV